MYTRNNPHISGLWHWMFIWTKYIHKGLNLRIMQEKIPIYLLSSDWDEYQCNDKKNHKFIITYNVRLYFLSYNRDVLNSPLSLNLCGFNFINNDFIIQEIFIFFHNSMNLLFKNRYPEISARILIILILVALYVFSNIFYLRFLFFIEVDAFFHNVTLPQMLMIFGWCYLYH